MKIVNSDEVQWAEIFKRHKYIIVNYQPEVDCKGCPEINRLFQDLASQEEYAEIKFMWVDSRNNPIAEQFIKKTQTPFLAAFKEGFLVECKNIADEDQLRAMLQRLFVFQFKL